MSFDGYLTRLQITTCAVLSKTCYITNPIEYLNNEVRGYQLDIDEMIPIHPNDPGVHHFIMAVSETTKTLYLSFRGTDNFFDVLTDISFIPTTSNVEGTFHRGFVKRANSVRVDLFVDQYLEKGYKVICCGHSLGKLHIYTFPNDHGYKGGSIAALVAIRLLKSHNHTDQKKIYCVGFGAPMFGCKVAKEKLSDCEDQFLWFVNKRDIVPASLFLLQQLSNSSDSANAQNLKDCQSLDHKMISEDESLVDEKKMEEMGLIESALAKLSSIGSIFNVISLLMSESKKNGFNMFTITGLIWKVIMLAAPKIKATISEIFKFAIKSSNYVMIGKFFTFNHKNEIVAFNNEQIETPLENTNEIVNSINGHRMIHYLNNLNHILVKCETPQKREIKTLSKFTIDGIEPYLPNVISVRKENEQVQHQSTSKTNTVFYYITELSGRSFVINILGNEKLTCSITGMTSSRKDVKISYISNEETYSTETRFRIDSKDQLSSKENFTFEINFWFGTISFSFPLSFVRESTESKQSLLYRDMDPLCLLFRALQFVYSGRISKKSDTYQDLKKLLLIIDQNLDSIQLTNEMFHIKNKSSILYSIDKLFKKFASVDSHVLTWVMGIVGGAILVGSISMAIVFLPGAFVVSPLVAAGNSLAGGAFSIQAILSIAGIFLGTGATTPFLVKEVSKLFHKTIQMYCELLENLLKSKKEDTSKLRKEEGFHFDIAERKVLQHKHSLMENENEKIRQAVNCIQYIQNIRNDLINQPIQVGLYSKDTTSKQLKSKLENTPLFMYGSDCNISIITALHTDEEQIKVKNSYYDLIVLLLDLKEVLDDNWEKNSAEMASHLENGSDDYLICINVPHNHKDMSIFRKLDKFKSLPGMAMLINLESPNISGKIMSHEYIYSYILDKLSQDNCEKFSFVNYVVTKFQIYGNEKITHTLLASKVSDILTRCKLENSSLECVYEQNSLTLLDEKTELNPQILYMVSDRENFNNLLRSAFQISSPSTPALTSNNNKDQYVYLKFIPGSTNERKKQIKKPSTLEELETVVYSLKNVKGDQLLMRIKTVSLMLNS